MADSIKLLFGKVSGVGPRNHVLGAHWRHLANTVEQLCMPAVSGSDTMDDNSACF